LNDHQQLSSFSGVIHAMLDTPNAGRLSSSFSSPSIQRLILAHDLDRPEVEFNGRSLMRLAMVIRDDHHC
jgi:hypothetical protein